MPERYPYPAYRGPVQYGVPIQIPTQPADMGKKYETKKREEIMLLVIFMLLAVVISIGAFIAVTVLQHYAGDIFDKIEKAGLSAKNLSSLSSYIRIPGMRFVGMSAGAVLLAVIFLSHGATTFVMMIVWALSNLITILVIIAFFVNSSKKPANALEIGAIVVGFLSLLTWVFMPLEIVRNATNSKYWIPSTHNYISVWVMIPTILWGIYLLIYFICAIVSMCRKKSSTDSPQGGAAA
ncbi:MAG: hypothetical protein J6Y08_04710 [Clostridiales bacterium]|nr:hypothetical protein [Clostridiales bacterium]